MYGHAGYAANLSLLQRGPNEASEYFWARKFGPGLDVGDPMRRISAGSPTASRR
ncbi:type VI immunity family protein [Burkholderia gladioli]|uniref:type VI immunity family protein n=1 Tax=Burkholderia gladioli TaxID=28095 RepID=UPI0022B755AC|nr:type VI immunity family protein [Burkholderia gladioli]